MQNEVTYHPTVYRIVSMEGVDPDKLKDAKSAESDMKHLAEIWKVKIVFGPHVHPFEGGGNGFTGMAVIAQSEFNIHSWPEEGRLDINVGTCGDDHRLEETLEPSLLEMYSPRRMESTLVNPRIISGRGYGIDGTRVRIYESTDDTDPTTYPKGRWRIYEGIAKDIVNDRHNLQWGTIKRGDLVADLAGYTYYPF